jgi:hypothetical protein
LPFFVTAAPLTMRLSLELMRELVGFMIGRTADRGDSRKQPVAPAALRTSTTPTRASASR